MKEPTPLKTVVAMPAYNEDRYIGSIVLRARQYADEVIVVDDGSSDFTSKVAELAGATVIRHEGNRGYGAAIQSILAEAQKRSLDVLVILDADSQHNPDEIPILTKAISEGFDLVIGSRQIQAGNIPRYRHMGQNVLAYFTRILSKRKLVDTESGFRAYSRKAVATIKPRERGMAISAEIISEAVANGLKVTEVPVTAIYTKDGSSLNPIRHGLGVLNRIMVMISEKRPFLFFGLCGGISILLGIIAGVVVVRTLFAAEVLNVGTALISMLLMTVGMLSVSTGLILNVVSKRLSSLETMAGKEKRES